jgi:hypothetical protein
VTSLIKALKLLSMRLFVEKKPAAGIPTDTSALTGTAVYSRKRKYSR